MFLGSKIIRQRSILEIAHPPLRAGKEAAPILCFAFVGRLFPQQVLDNLGLAGLVSRKDRSNRS